MSECQNVRSFSPFLGGGDSFGVRVRRYARSMAASEIQVPKYRSRTSRLSILSDVTDGRVVCWVRVITIFFLTTRPGMCTRLALPLCTVILGTVLYCERST